MWILLALCYRITSISVYSLQVVQQITHKHCSRTLFNDSTDFMTKRILNINELNILFYYSFIFIKLQNSRHRSKSHRIFTFQNVKKNDSINATENCLFHRAEYRITCDESSEYFEKKINIRRRSNCRRIEVMRNIRLLNR